MSDYFARPTGNKFAASLSPATPINASDTLSKDKNSASTRSSSVEVARHNIESSLKTYSSNKPTVLIKRYGIR